eukprot:7381718-Prymnesium_polylepis.1
MARTTTPEIFIAAVRFWAFGAIVRSKAVSRSASLGVDAPRNSCRVLWGIGIRVIVRIEEQSGGAQVCVLRYGAE